MVAKEGGWWWGRWGDRKGQSEQRGERLGRGKKDVGGGKGRSLWRMLLVHRVGSGV